MGMELQVLSGSVVVLAEQHNPTILHPAFLESQKIVEGAWELAEAPICTPPVSVVRYANGLTFTTEVNKFQVVDEGEVTNMSQSRAGAMAASYISALPHVRYTAVGINFTGIIVCDQGGAFLIEKFLKPGSWHCQANEPQALGVKLVYPLDETRLHLSLDPGEASRADAEKKMIGILVNANFHTPISGLEEARRAIGTFATRYTEFRDRVNIIFELES
jgi:hypothetical protein